jgi:BirA family biotin operon repressor/biotin-[acetyl-CoA-carboxylase] ligase
MTDPAESRPPIDVTDPRLADLTAPGGSRWRVEVVEETTSTNADVADRFRDGEEEGLVLVAEHQSSGRGRLGREWVAPTHSSLTVSFLLVPHAPPERWPWLPLLTGVAAASAVRRVTGVEVELKWPNDVLSGGLKLGGILLERVERAGRSGPEAAAVVGIGINCAQSGDELPVPHATSLAILTGAPVDRGAVLAGLVEELGALYEQWESGADLRSAYLDLCRTPGQDVRVAVPGGEIVGRAVDVDESGRLVVRTQAGEEHLGAGDVVYVRPQAGPGLG